VTAETPHGGLALRMVRPHLRDVPACALPDDVSTRWFRPGDVETWVRIHAEAAPELNASRAMFEKYFGIDPGRLAERQLYAIDATGSAIGTVTAWFNDDYDGGRWGRIHFLAVVPSCEGRGIARALMTLACRLLRDLGHERAYLATDSTRVRAIRIYRYFGFVPDIRSEADREAWSKVPV
jgi:ribosomal protein S18 acetylase RimI-like enzyme